MRLVEEMAKRKSAIDVEEVLPDDSLLRGRSIMWTNFMDKYKKRHEENEKNDEADDIVLENIVEMLDYEPSEHSNASDVETDNEFDEENSEKDFVPEEVTKQLVKTVAKRRRVWAKSGLMDLMKAVEYDANMPSDLKVEKWLLEQHTGPFDMTRNHETVVTERTADGDRMRFSRKQEVTLSRDADDADSLSTVDEKRYILQNKKDRNVTSKIKVIQTFRIKTNSVANALIMRPKFHSVSFPIPEENEDPTPCTSLLQKTSKSDSAFETGEDLSQNRSREPAPKNTATVPSVLPCRQDNRRKKVFKKTAKKKVSIKSPSKKGSSASSAAYESALQRSGTVKKVFPGRRIHWKEMSFRAESSSDESDKVSNARVTRSKAKSSPKRELRSKSSRSSVTPEASPRKLSPRKKASQMLSPRKTVDRELVGTFNAICLSPKKKQVNFRNNPPQAPPRQTCADQITDQTTDQTTNLTALFSSANERITNSTAVSHNTTSFVSRSIIPNPELGIVVYKPKAIQPDVSDDARIFITAEDLELAEVKKERHLQCFQKFNHKIHPNSQVVFFPSDSEDDEPRTTATTTNTNNSDEDLSFDDDDPILTFRPRDAGRLNVIEIRHY